MGRRIEVELTSSRDDGTWTWRAAGARQPKGVLDAALLYEGAQVGDVVRAEADFEIEGILITAVLPPKDKKRSEPERLEIIGPPREHQGVTSSLVPKSERPRPERGRGRDREDRPPRPGRDGDRRTGPPRPREERERTGGPPGRRPEARRGPDGRGTGEGRPRTDGGRPAEDRRGPRPAREGGPRPDGAARPPAASAEPAAPKPKRLAPANVHRAAVVATLPPEQRPIAEQVLRGGIPAVRQAIETQNAQLRAEGQPEVHADPLLAMAEQLLPQLKAADWRDRAEAAAKVVDDVSLRDLRSVVAGADAARDDEARLLAGTLRQALERRLTEQRERWVTDITTALDDGRLVRALRLSARPPDTATRFPAELALRLSEAAGAAMSPDTAPDRWNTLLEAVADSPVRRSVKPAGLPVEPGDALLHAARQAAGRVPALAALLGIAMPPPPGPPRPARPGARAGARPPRSPGPGGGRRRPPPPPPPPVTSPPAEVSAASDDPAAERAAAPPSAPRPEPEPAPAAPSPEPPGADVAPGPAPAMPEVERPQPHGPTDAAPLGDGPVPAPVPADAPDAGSSEVGAS